MLTSKTSNVCTLHVQKHKQGKVIQRFLALDLQVECDLVGAPVVAGHTAVVPRILGFHCADDEAAVSVDAPATIHQDGRGRSISAERKTETRLGKCLSLM